MTLQPTQPGAEHPRRPRGLPRGLPCAQLEAPRSRGGGVVFVALWPVAMALSLPAPVMVAPLLAHVAGMLAGYGVLVLVTLMSRWPLLERGIGGDRLARWHATTGRAVVVLVALHALAAVQAWAQSRRLSIPAALWDVLGMPWLISATLGTIAMITVAVVSVRAARRRLRYETWHALHLWTYVAVALSFVHQLAGPDLTGHRWLQVLWALLYAHTFGLVLRYRVLAPLRQAARHRLACLPGRAGDTRRRVHRHLRARRRRAARRARPVLPLAVPDPRHLAHRTPVLALRATPLGPAPAYREGTRRRQPAAAAPRGRHLGRRRRPLRRDDRRPPHPPQRPADRRRRRHHPDARPLRDDPRAPRARTTTCCCSTGRAPATTSSSAHELDQIAAQRRARVIYLLGDNREHLTTTSLTRLVPDLAERDVYLCGPPGMAEAVRRSVLAAGLPSAYLHEERFTI